MRWSGHDHFKRILYIRAQEEMFAAGHRSAVAVQHAAGQAFVWANWRGLESMLKLQLKLKSATWCRPAHRGRRQLFGTDRHAGFLSDGG